MEAITERNKKILYLVTDFFLMSSDMHYIIDTKILLYNSSTPFIAVYQMNFLKVKQQPGFVDKCTDFQDF